MTSLDNPSAIRHFQSLCDACQSLASDHKSPGEMRLYADGYLHALRKCNQLDRKDLEKLEKIIERWVLDPSSFIGPDGNISNLYSQKELDN